jgi:hypothetical protein
VQEALLAAAQQWPADGLPDSLAGDDDAAIAHYRAAAGRTTSLAERDYLTSRAARIGAS